jgi:hypothetical protein
MRSRWRQFGGRMDKEVGYYTRRAAEARRAGTAAANEKVRSRHLAFAAAYDEKVIDLKAKARRSTLHIIAA